MPTPARAKLARLLAGAQPTRADSAVLRLPGDTLTLEVAALGSIRTPIRAAQAKQLISAARPAEFGHGEETLSDDSVRDTWVIDPERVHLGGPNWRAQLDEALAHFADELGLPDGARLTAELHSLLIYGKGQFFLPHQDSEKHDQMVATLVVMLPSVHTGGALVVDDAGTAKTYTGSRDDLTMVAFYADRRHEVRPVRSGYRVSLTFNLLLAGPETDASGGPVAAASAYLAEHFATRAVSEYGGRDLGEPTRLAFLLDHEYSQVALTAGRFKGADGERIATLRAAAADAGCEIVLALAEIKEVWDVVPEHDSWQHDWYGDDEDEEDDTEPGSDGDYALNSLLDDEIVLGWWTSPGGGESIALSLSDHEVCAVAPTKSLTPYQSEYEGYMGNYGNTVDRWYRRAAVVVWPAEKAFAARAEAGSAWALTTLLERIDAGELGRARADAVSLEPFWMHLEVELLAPALRVAAGLEDPDVARLVAAPFRIEMLTTEHAPLLTALALTYSDAWAIDLLGQWQRAGRFGDRDRLAWVATTLVPLCERLREQGSGVLADGCANLVWRGLHPSIETWLGHAHAGRRRTNLAEFGVPLARVVEAASEALGTSIVAELRGAGDNLVDLLVPVLRAQQQMNTAMAALAEEASSRLARIADRPLRADDDWSIEWSGCGCDVCDGFARFVGAQAEQSLEWPLVTAGRDHVQQQIDAAELPIRHSTRRHGRPYTLVLEKTEQLFRGEQEERERARAERAWLATALE